MCQKIAVTKTRTVLVDDCDADIVRGLPWRVIPRGVNQRVDYAYVRNGPGPVLAMHRMILGAKLGRPLTRSEQVDHVNGNGLDNRRDNLRLATSAQQRANSRKKTTKRGTSSKYKGVCWMAHLRKWHASVTKSGVRYNLGYHYSEEDAARAYDLKARELYGEFAKLNFPGEVI